MARPRYVPDEEQRKMVKTLAGYGIPHEQIANKIGVTAKTLRRHFREELDKGLTDANAQVIQTLFKLSISGKCPAATMYWASKRVWKDPGSGGREGQPSVPFVVEVIQTAERPA
jgi:hypothetical protein